MALSKVAGYLLAGTVVVGSISAVAVQNSDNIFNGVNGFKDKITQLWDNQEVLKEIINDKNATIKEKVAEANAVINGKIEEINTLNGKIDEQTSKISQLETDLATANGNTSEKEAELQKAKDDLSAYEQELQALSDYVDEIEAELATKGITDETVTNVDASEFKLSQEETEIEDGEAPTLAENIDDYLTNDTNRNQLVNYSVELVNGDWVTVEVVQTSETPDLNGRHTFTVNYIVADNASINPNAIIGMGTTTLAKYIENQASELTTEFDANIRTVNFNNEAGETYASWGITSGMKTTGYNN